MQDPETNQDVTFQATIRRGEPSLRQSLANKTSIPAWKKKLAAGGYIGALLLGVASFSHIYQNRPYTESVCETTPLTALLWQGGDDSKRAETIQNIEQYLSTTDNRDDQVLGEAALQILRADAQGVDLDTINPDAAETSVIQNLLFNHQMRVDNFDAALATITNAIDNRALDCAETGAWDNNNRRNTIIRFAFNNGHLEQAYQIASHIFSNDPTTQFNLNLWAGDIQLSPDMPDANAATALTHFEAARTHAESEVNVSRTEYSLGLAHDALGSSDQAREHFLLASRHPENIYGQLGAHLSGNPFEVTIPQASRDPRDPPLAMAVTIDDCSNRLLIDQRADTPASPASLTKMMALYTFAQIMADENVDLNLDTMIPVPAIIRDKLPSDLATFENLTVGRELPVRSFLTMSGARSDAISTLTLAMAAARAKGWEGTPEQLNDRFVALMNENARHLGMTKSNFGNVIGNNAARGDKGNIGAPVDFTKLIRAFHTDHPRVFEIALGQSRIDISPISQATTPSSRSLRDNPNVIGAKTGFLRDIDPTYGIAAGYNETLRVEFRDITGRQSTASIAVFGADSADNRYDIMRGIINHLPQIDTRAFCAAPANFRYHPTDLAFYTARRQP